MNSQNSQDCVKPESAEEIAEFVRIVAWSFAAEEEAFATSAQEIGHEALRVIRVDGKVAGGFVAHPLGQWFGGRRVSMAGVGVVGVASEARGAGVATRLMDGAIREFDREGYAISTLYPAKQALYRRSGFERAGARYLAKTETSRFVLRDDQRKLPRLDVRPATDADFPAIHEVHRTFASRENGPIDRTPFLWKRVTSPPKRNVRGFVVEGSSGIEGYVYFDQVWAERTYYNVSITDFVSVTEAAGRTLVAFIGDHRSLSKTVEWFGRLSDPHLMLLEETRVDVGVFFPWMIRIVSVERALGDRGYAPGVEAEVHFRVEDELLSSNHDKFILRVAGARGVVTRGGRGDLHTGVRGLASIYSGFLTPEAAKRSGLLDGPDEALRSAAAVFAGPGPWMPDMF